MIPDAVVPDFSHIIHELRPNGVLELTISRPERLNAWNQDLIDDFSKAFRYAHDCKDVRSVLITGDGDAFSVGGDVELLEDLMTDVEFAARGTITTFVEIVRGMIDLDKPIIAAINGHVIGGGSAIALMCDVTFMSDKARILCGGQLNIGVVPADAPFLWPMLMSMAKAKYHLFNSTFIDAVEAERIGLVSQVVPHAELLDTARAYADKMAGRDPTALAWTKRALNHWLRHNSAILDFAVAAEGLGFIRPQAREGLEEMRKVIGKS
jgi:enoyl-CoA hydratase